MAPKASSEKKAGEKKSGESSKKWTEAAEHDLLMAVLASNATGGSIKINWPAVCNAMKVLGYDFSDSAINQKFGKGIMRDFREKHGQDIIARIAGSNKGADGGPVQPAAATPRKKAGNGASTPGSKRKKTTAAVTPVDSPSKGDKKSEESIQPGDSDIDDDEVLHSPSKKVKSDPEVVDEFELGPEFANDKPIQFGVFLEQKSHVGEV